MFGLSNDGKLMHTQAPCQHNFCLACFGKWTAKGNKQCPTCRAAYPAAFANNPRINTALAVAIRMARLGERPAARAEQQRIANADRPDEAFTTDRAVSGCCWMLHAQFDGHQTMQTVVHLTAAATLATMTTVRQ